MDTTEQGGIMESATEQSACGYGDPEDSSSSPSAAANFLVIAEWLKTTAALMSIYLSDSREN